MLRCCPVCRKAHRRRPERCIAAAYNMAHYATVAQYRADCWWIRRWQWMRQYLQERGWLAQAAPVVKAS
jgi:hypothetical protein